MGAEQLLIVNAGLRAFSSLRGAIHRFVTLPLMIRGSRYQGTTWYRRLQARLWMKVLRQARSGRVFVIVASIELSVMALTLVVAVMIGANRG